MSNPLRAHNSVARHDIAGRDLLETILHGARAGGAQVDREFAMPHPLGADGCEHDDTLEDHLRTPSVWVAPWQEHDLGRAQLSGGCVNFLCQCSEAALSHARASLVLIRHGEFTKYDALAQAALRNLCGQAGELRHEGFDDDDRDGDDIHSLDIHVMIEKLTGMPTGSRTQVLIPWFYGSRMTRPMQACDISATIRGTGHRSEQEVRVPEDASCAFQAIASSPTATAFTSLVGR